VAKFDHIEVHVGDIQRYCRFLVDAFEGGTHEVISKTGTSMFTSPDGIRIEVKRRKSESEPMMSGFCNPCLRRQNPHELVKKLGFAAHHELETESGTVVFFLDHEGVMWHVKDLP
jgi:hypothetical protein